MPRIVYEIVGHEDGFAYKVGDVFSETFPTREAAAEAARVAAAEQELAGPAEEIEYQDEAGEWHEELAPGDDRPETDVQD